MAIECDASTAVDDFVTALLENGRLHSLPYYVVFEGRRLDGGALADYGVRSGSTVVVAPRLVGGGPCCCKAVSPVAIEHVYMQMTSESAPGRASHLSPPAKVDTSVVQLLQQPLIKDELNRFGLAAERVCESLTAQGVTTLATLASTAADLLVGIPYDAVRMMTMIALQKILSLEVWVVLNELDFLREVRATAPVCPDALRVPPAIFVALTSQVGPELVKQGLTSMESLLDAMRHEGSGRFEGIRAALETDAR